MSGGLGPGVGGVVLDIEGTTTPISFVYERLFPFARSRLDAFLRVHARTADWTATHDRLHAEWTADVSRGEQPPDWRGGSLDEQVASATAYLAWLMDRDRKSPELKRIQGLIWDNGYRSGALAGEVFDDVPRALERWKAAGLAVAIYSSGSVLAQRRLFETTPAGDLTRFITAYFDTAVGAKLDPASYRRIAQALRHDPEALVFVSDVDAELGAAREAGWRTVLCVRPGNRPQRSDTADRLVHTFDELSPGRGGAC